MKFTLFHPSFSPASITRAAERFKGDRGKEINKEMDMEGRSDKIRDMREREKSCGRLKCKRLVQKEGNGDLERLFVWCCDPITFFLFLTFMYRLTNFSIDGGSVDPTHA